jgi:hypothetical protein
VDESIGGGAADPHSAKLCPWAPALLFIPPAGSAIRRWHWAFHVTPSCRDLSLKVGVQRGMPYGGVDFRQRGIARASHNRSGVIRETKTRNFKAQRCIVNRIQTTRQ